MKIIFLTLGFVGCLMMLHAQQAQHQTGKSGYYLIAHRGGVVDSTKPENSLAAMQAAAARGYQMVEVDLRITRDSVMIIHHDPDFKRYYQVDKAVKDMTWKEISELTNPATGSKVLKLEDALNYCQGKMSVMLDNKIPGNDTILFARLIQLLKRYNLDKDAFMIGTDESTEFFTGKIKLSCTRQQLESNMRKPGYTPSHYYLFGDELTKEDVTWAQKNNIVAVGVVNAWRYRKATDPKTAATKNIAALKATGLHYFQIDSEYDDSFFNESQQ